MPEYLIVQLGKNITNVNFIFYCLLDEKQFTFLLSLVFI